MSPSWQGWRPLPDATAAEGWVDLSHVLWDGMPRMDYFAPPAFERVRSMPADPLNLSRMELICHSGTHLDAPCHFVADAPAMDEVPLERLLGEAVLWRLEGLAEDDLIEVEALAAAQPPLADGDAVLIDTGWGAKWPSGDYGRHPSLSPAAAEWLVEQGARMVGIDFATPDLAGHRRPEGFDWPVHRILLSQGVLVIEHLRNLDRLQPGRLLLLCLPLAIQGGDGAPARVLARPL